MRTTWAVCCLAGCMAFTALAQDPPKPAPPADQDRYEKAHEGVFGAQPDKAAEASRLTQAVAAALPPSATQAIVRKNLIDQAIFGRMERDHVPHAPVASDEEFVRRVYLDATGGLPSPDAVRAFLASRDPKKRDQLIDSLIGTEEFANEWAWYWGDLFRTNDTAGTGSSFHFYTKQWLKVDRPYNDVFADIVTAVAKDHSSVPATGFYSAANYNATRALSPTDPDNYYLSNRLDFIDEVNVDVSRIFLGVNIDCISCHNGAGHLNSINLYLSKRKRSDFHQQAAFFGKMRVVDGWSDRVLNIDVSNAIYDDSGPGYNTADDGPFATEAETRFPRAKKTYEPAFMLTGETPQPGENPRHALGRILPTHIQFARAAVNLVWTKLMVVGFIDTYDGFDLDRLDPKNPPPAPWTIQPTNPELLDALARDFQSNNFSIQHLIKTIMKSSAYQLSTHFEGEWKDAYVPYYARRFARVMSGPEAADAIATATSRPYQFSLLGQPVSRVLELAGPSGVGGRGRSSEGLVVSALLQSFFQSNRQTPATLGNTASSVQAMLMMVSPVVGNRVAAEKGTRVSSLLESGKSNPEILEELFLASLARRPTAGEVKASEFLLAKDRKTGLEDIQWALLNSPEFLLNH
jgi:hypothetical protein